MHWSFIMPVLVEIASQSTRKEEYLNMTQRERRKLQFDQLNLSLNSTSNEYLSILLSDNMFQFGQNNSSSDIKFYLDVLLPELLIRICMAESGKSYTDAENFLRNEHQVLKILNSLKHSTI
jgi:hypothetical protein